MKQLINFFDGYVDGQYVWFSNLCFNSFMRMDLYSGEVVEVGSFPQCDKTRENLHIRVFRHQNKLIFIPYNGGYIHIWNMQGQCWEESVSVEKNVFYVNAVKKESDIWIFPQKFTNKIIRYNIVENKVYWEEQLRIEINSLVNEGVTLAHWCLVEQGAGILLVLYGKPVVVEIDLHDRKICKVHKLKLKIPVSSISDVGNNRFVLFLNNSCEAYIWNKASNELDKMKINVSIYTGRIPFQRAIKISEQEIIIIPCHLNSLFLWNISTLKITEINLPSDFERCRTVTLFCFYKIVQNNIYLFPRGGNKLVSIDLTTMEVKTLAYKFEDEEKSYFEGIINQKFEKKIKEGVLKESDGWTSELPQFLDFVCAGTKSDYLHEKQRNAGEQIYNYVSIR